MYTAQFSLAGGHWAVAAGRVDAGAGSPVPAEMLSALSEGRLTRLSVRFHHAPTGLRTEILLPREVPVTGPWPPEDLAASADVEWCRSAEDYDAMARALGPHRVWLDVRGFGVRGLACAVEASWLPDSGLFRQLSHGLRFTHQINLVAREPNVEEHRQLRKHLARLEILAQDPVWPAPWLQAQRQLVERRLGSAWLCDELLACSDAAAGNALVAALRDRLVDQGGVALADATLQTGSFDELLLTGLDCEQFLDVTPLECAGRSVAESVLLAALGQRTQAPKAYDMFLSHASADAALACRLCAEFESLGLRCWIAPRDIAAGQHYADVIDDALRDSRAVVVLMSAAALASPHVLRELERAVHYQARLLPVRIEPVQPQRAFSYLLSGCQWADATGGVDPKALASSLSAAEGVIRAPRPAPTAGPAHHTRP